jgi:hypothetical protein
VKRSNALILLSSLIVVLALFAAGVGLFWQNGDNSFTFTTLRGTTAQIYGQGIYRYDTVFAGAGFRGQDVVALFLGVPLLIVSLVLYVRNSLQGGLLLLGLLGYFLYVYASMALAAAYNNLFFVYVALFAASFFAFVLAFTAVDAKAMYDSFLNRLPHLLIGIFMIVSGLLTLYVWAEPLITGLLETRPPDRLDSYTTFVTVALDLALITPTVLLAGILILRRRPLGYHLAFPLLILIVMLLPTIVLNTVLQIAAGVVFTTPEIVGPIAGFVLLGGIALWIVAIILRTVASPTQLQAVHA